MNISFCNRRVTTFAAAVLILSIFAQISISLPISEGGIPVTGQTLAVLLVGFLLPPLRGSLAVAAYLAMGAMGIPVFAGGSAGIEVLAGGRGGYLLGFVVASLLMGFLGERDWGRSLRRSILAMTMGTVIIVAFGIARLTMIYDFGKALEYGFYPFIGGAVVKILLGAAIARSVWKYREEIR